MPQQAKTREAASESEGLAGPIGRTRRTPLRVPGRKGQGPLVGAPDVVVEAWAEGFQFSLSEETAGKFGVSRVRPSAPPKPTPELDAKIKAGGREVLDHLRLQRLVEEALGRKDRDPSEAPAIVSRLEVMSEVLAETWNSWKSRQPDAAKHAAKILKVLETVPIGSPDEMATTRRVLSRFVRVFGKPDHCPRKDRQWALRGWMVTAIRDEDLLWRSSQPSADILAILEKRVFGKAPETPVARKKRLADVAERLRD